MRDAAVLKQRVRRELLPPLLALASFLELAPSEDFERYRRTALDASSEYNLWQAFDQVISRHTSAWQALLDQCSMQPGR